MCSANNVLVMVVFANIKIAKNHNSQSKCLSKLKRQFLTGVSLFPLTVYDVKDANKTLQLLRAIKEALKEKIGTADIAERHPLRTSLATLFVNQVREMTQALFSFSSLCCLLVRGHF